MKLAVRPRRGPCFCLNLNTISQNNKFPLTFTFLWAAFNIHLKETKLLKR